MKSDSFQLVLIVMLDEEHFICNFDLIIYFRSLLYTKYLKKCWEILFDRVQPDSKRPARCISHM